MELLTAVPFDVLVGAALVVTFSYTVVGLTGFGASITGMPLLVHLMPLRVALPMMLFYDMCSSALLGLRNRRLASIRELLWLLPTMLIGIVLGVTVLVSAPERWLLFALGVFVLAYSAWSMLSRIGTKPLARGWALPLGGIGGVFSALFGTGGPVYTIYLARRISDKSALRATAALTLFVSSLIRVPLFLGADLYAQPELLLLVPAMAPFVLLGMWIGNRLHHRLPAQHVVRVVWAILVVGGIGLLVRALG